MKWFTRAAFGRMLAIALVVFGTLAVFLFMATSVPGRSHEGPLPAPNHEQIETAQNLRSHVEFLCWSAGPRNYEYMAGMSKAVEMISGKFRELGYEVRLSPVPLSSWSPPARSPEFWNIVAEKEGRCRPQEIVIVGAHYDTVAGTGTLGADDNASGVAGVLELARLISAENTERTVRFIAFANEEPPFFHTEQMGSMAYARTCLASGEKVVAMICLEMIGYYDSRPGSQQYPPPLGALLEGIYPSEGNFIAMVSDWRSRPLLHRTIASFRAAAEFPSEGVSLPGWIPGVNWSDHYSFWEHGYPAIMVTDTAMYRNRRYHTTSDTPESLNYDAMSRVVCGLKHSVLSIASSP